MNSLNLLLVGIILFSAVVAFQLVTLPVELNASHRAVLQLTEAGLVSNDEIPMVKKVLGAAALTYLAATLSSMSNLLYYVMIFTGGSDD
jgi:Zn-dependent membrane protease YugP